MMAARWSDTEIHLLKHHYSKRGAVGVQKLLERHGFKRSLTAITWRACQLNILFGQPKGLVPLLDVHPRTGANGVQADSVAIKAASADGVLTTLRAGGRVIHMVPEGWADAYAEELGRRLASERQYKSWLSTSEFADLLNVSPDLVRTARRRPEEYPTLHSAIAGVRCARLAKHSALRWHPVDSRLAANRLRVERS